MRICLGGTFWPFHAGHEALLAHAFQADEVFVGITEGNLAKRDRIVPPWRERADVVEGFARQRRFAGRLHVDALRDAAGPAASGDYDAIVVSPETVTGAQRINAARQAGGLRPLRIFVVDHVMAADGMPISGTRIARGDIDRKGRRLKPIRVRVGSQNPVKVEGVRRAFKRLLVGQIVDVAGVDVRSGVAEQPTGKDTLRGARNRVAAIAAAQPDFDYAVGVEAGLNQDDDGQWFDVQACVVRDAAGRTTEGWGPAFAHPGWVTRRALDGEMISDILAPVAQDPRIGGTTGAIGYLTDGAMDRTELTRIAVTMALVPRWRPHLYARAPARAVAKRSSEPGA